VNSDFAHADEASDLDWIPDEAHHPGPSYDPATGRFATGTGMNGPLYWQLNTPGEGVENGLITGPPDIGKTNNLLVPAVEALSSQIFVYCLADPRDRNGIVDILGRAAHDVARTPEETLQLFGKVAARIDHRAADPDRYRDPTADFPGVLLLLDDAQEVLRDPAAAGLAEKIVLSGPPVGIGMIVSTPSLEPADFGGRRELVLALAQTNCITYSLDHLEQMKKLRASR
jgi:hypothetical protein